ncbi:MAG TPA: VTT domain-containing protein [Rubricoccaceae bacterium]
MTFAKGLTYFWIALLGGVLVLWAVRPDAFTADAVERALRSLGPWAFAGFAVVSLVRGALLVPSTPVVLAGGALFPEASVAVLIVSMVGILATAAVLYRFPGFAGYDARLAARYPDQLARLQVHLAKPRAPAFVALWAFFPVVPTDLICYAAGLVRMPFRRLMLGIVVGELPLVAAYVFVGKRVAEWLSL